MTNTYYFISINHAVEVYVQKGIVLAQISSAVTYEINSDDLWSWFANRVGKLVGSHVYFLADEQMTVPSCFLHVTSGDNLAELKSAVKSIFMETDYDVFYGEASSFYSSAKSKEKQSLFLIYPSETLEEEVTIPQRINYSTIEGESTTVVKVERSKKSDETQKLITGEKSAVKKAFENLFDDYHTKN